jgi:N-methylhydantoinase A
MDEKRIAIDVGGTFTDVVTLDGARLGVGKVATTPDDPARGVLDAFDASGVAPVDVAGFVHGTTLGLNALLTRTGARTGIITTAGFRDVYLLGRTDRVPMYDITYRRPPSLVERAHILEVDERLDFTGAVLTEFDEQSARAAARRAVELGLESIAVCFLHSYVNPDHEQRMGAILAEEAPDLEVTVSSELSRELREYERTSTAVFDAYIKPIVRRYLARLEDTLEERGFDGQFLLTRSGGGALTAAAAKDAPVNLILSGPAGGVLGAAWFSEVADLPNLITIDMGGTSLDASLVVDGEPLTYVDATFESLPINLPSLYIHTIGAGGGSKVWVDEGGALQVGPASAGADPGPAAYGRGGTDATFTDAAMQTGYLAGDLPLAGTLALDAALAGQALQPTADQLGLSLDDLALGVVRISVTKIVGAVRAITVELGHDPADFALLTFGGGGGLVAVDVARELSIPKVVVPPGPGAFCAFGMLMAHVQHDDARSRIGPLADLDLDLAQADLEQMRTEADEALAHDGFGPEAREFTFAADLRYLGQEHSVTLPIGEKLTAEEVERVSGSFAEAHARQYGHTMTDPVELVALRLTAVGHKEPPTLPELESRTDGRPEPQGTRQVRRPGGQSFDYELYLRDGLLVGDRVAGPAIIAEHTSTTVMHRGDIAEVGPHGELVISIEDHTDGEA